MIYRDYLKNKMNELAKRPETVFIGYNIGNGSKGYGTFAEVPRNKIIEMPCAEALMTGMATGMALAGYRPVLFFERHDFLLLAADQIINHLAKILTLSHGDFNPCVYIRAVVGEARPFDPGPQHLGNFTRLFTGELDIVELRSLRDVCKYNLAFKVSRPAMLIEHRALYSKELV